jgi:hypothetical protein
MHFSVTAVPTIKAFVFLNEQELFEPPPFSFASPPPDELSEDDELFEDVSTVKGVTGRVLLLTPVLLVT